MAEPKLIYGYQELRCNPEELQQLLNLWGARGWRVADRQWQRLSGRWVVLMERRTVQDGT